MTINPQINTKDFLLALEREADNRENERFIEPVDYKTYDAIKSIDKFCGLNQKSKLVKDSYVLQTMRYLELLKELKKSGNKNKKTL